MPDWDEYLIEDPQTLMDRMQGFAGYKKPEDLKNILTDQFGKRVRIVIGDVVAGYSKKDFDNSRSYADYLIRRARPRLPIGNDSRWANSKMFVSFSAMKSFYTGVSVTNGKLQTGDRSVLMEIQGSMKQDGSLFGGADQIRGLNDYAFNEALENLMDEFIENGWREVTSSRVNYKKFPTPFLDNVEFATGDFSFGSIPEESDVSELVECLERTQREIMERRDDFLKVESDALFYISEKIITSNYHDEPVRKVIPMAVVSSSFRYQLGDDSIGDYVGFDIAGTMGNLDGLVKYLDKEEDKIIERAIKKIDETKKIKSIFDYKGKIRAILTPPVAGVYGHELCHDAECDHTLKDFEEMVDSWELGKEMFSENVTIRDYPQDRKLFGYCPFDDLGILSKEKILIKNGKLHERMYGFDAAGYLEGKKNLENLVDGRTFKNLVRMTNTVIDPDRNGPKDMDEMIEMSRLINPEELPIIVFGSDEGGANFPGLDLKYLAVGLCYLIPKNGLWEDRIPLGYPNRPAKESGITFEDPEFGGAIPIIVGSRREESDICKVGVCGKSDYAEKAQNVGSSAPMMSLEVKLLIYGEEEESGKFLPPLSPISF